MNRLSDAHIERLLEAAVCVDDKDKGVCITRCIVLSAFE